MLTICSPFPSHLSPSFVRGGKEEESIAGVNNLLSFKQNRNSTLSLRVTRRNSPGLWKRMSAQQGASRKRVSE